MRDLTWERAASRLSKQVEDEAYSPAQQFMRQMQGMSKFPSAQEVQEYRRRARQSLESHRELDNYMDDWGWGNAGYPIAGAPLSIGKFRKAQVKENQGQVAEWMVKGSGLIVQEVRHKSKIHAGRQSHSKSHTFIEGWIVRNGKVYPASDYFLVPRKWVTNFHGSIEIGTKAWFLPGDGAALARRIGLKKGGHPIAGMLLSKDGKCPAKYRRPATVRRRWTASWTEDDKTPRYSSVNLGPE